MEINSGAFDVLGFLCNFVIHYKNSSHRKQQIEDNIMNLKSKFLGILLMSLFAICNVSCSKDSDTANTGYHLKLSKSSCEVVQALSSSVELTAHENTTLDIKNTDLIDAIYTWEFGSNKSKIEIIGKQKGETDIVITDHETGETATLKVEVTEYPMPRLGVDKLKGNIFDIMTFHLYYENSQSINANKLSGICDSIVWTAEGLNGSFRVFEKIDGGVGSKLTSKWGHCFMYPGEYKTYLTAWKDNKAIFFHQLDISVTNGKDFLAYNWNDITKDSQAWDSYIDVLKSSPVLITSDGINGTVPFVEVRLFGGDFAKSYQALFDYFSKLYSAPTYETGTGKQMWKLYDELFSEQKEYPNAYPYAIWVTKRANMVLLLFDDSMEYPAYIVYAEPNRQ
ncbi:MAG: hypothetical protein RR254_05710 [Muribaculaceae bacterium]